MKVCVGDHQFGLPFEASEDLELAFLIQAAAEKVENQQYLYARKLLSVCDRAALKAGNPVQRVVYYYAKALKERIDGESGIVSSDKLEGKEWLPVSEELDRIFLDPALVECQQELPFCLETQLITTESIMESVKPAKKVHLIDFEVDNGSQWILILQDFAARYEFPLEHLKITAVGACKKMMEETGKRLSSFAESINLPFSFCVVVSDLKDIKEDFFELEANEVIAIDLAFRLWTLLPWPNHLDAVIGVIKKIKPCVMIVKELEVCTDSSNFLERFYNSLAYFSAIFDSTKACMDHNIVYRKLIEEVHFSG